MGNCFIWKCRVSPVAWFSGQFLVGECFMLLLFKPSVRFLLYMWYCSTWNQLRCVRPGSPSLSMAHSWAHHMKHSCLVGLPEVQCMVLLHSSFLAPLPRKQCIDKLALGLYIPALPNFWTWLLGRRQAARWIFLTGIKSETWSQLCYKLRVGEVQVFSWRAGRAPPSFDLLWGVTSYRDVPLR